MNTKQLIEAKQNARLKQAEAWKYPSAETLSVTFTQFLSDEETNLPAGVVNALAEDAGWEAYRVLTGPKAVLLPWLASIGEDAEWSVHAPTGYDFAKVAHASEVIAVTVTHRDYKTINRLNPPAGVIRHGFSAVLHNFTGPRATLQNWLQSLGIAPDAWTENSPEDAEQLLHERYDILSAEEEQIADLQDADLTGADFAGADFSGANLSRADLQDADLRNAYLRGANLEEASLAGADLSGADLSEVELSEANLIGANFHGADLYLARFEDANLRSADFSGADLSGARIGEGWEIVNGRLRKQ